MVKYVNNRHVAILLGVYNAEKYIAAQLDSVLCQTYENWTLYIRDDASTDRTAYILEEYASLYDNIILVYDRLGNLGCNGNYFRLLSLVNSKCYMFCNADDFWYSNKIELSLNKFEEVNTFCENCPIIVHTDLSIGDDLLNVTSRSYWELVNTNPEFFKSYNYIGVCNVVAGATMFFNDLAKQVSFPVSENAPFFDHWMALCVAKTGKIVSIHMPTMIYRQIGTNLAGVVTDKDNMLLAKMLNMRNVMQANYNEYKMLRSIGWGGLFKYLYYRISTLLKIRLCINRYVSNKMKL